MTENIDLDAFDRRIIAAVQRDNPTPARALAERIGLSESAVLRRLRWLRSTGVIVGDIALVDPARLKPSIIVHVLVELHRHDRRTEQRFTDKIRQRPEVIGAWHVTGRTDYLLMVTAASIEDYRRFSDDILASDDLVRSFETLVSLREIVRFDPLRADRLA